MEKGSSFSECFRKNSVTLSEAYKRMLCKQLLTGLVALHDKGWMHRDITPMNVLYFSREPAHAALCDFGKLCRSKTDDVTTNARLPPEILENQRRTYDQKIDIWMLGYTLLYCWYYDCQQGMVMRDARDHATILERMSRASDHLSHLIITMLAWAPKDRPSALEAVAHPCLRDVVFDEWPEASTTKKRYLN